MKAINKINIVIAIPAFFIGLIVTFFVLREPMEPLKDHSLQVARQLWQNSHNPNYDMSYKMHGGEYDVKVRNNIVESLLLNGKKVTSTDRSAYSMNGLFKILKLEIENLTDPSGPYALQKDTIIARVRYNQKNGHIERYLRSSGGYGKGASIEIIHFEKTEYDTPIHEPENKPIQPSE